MTTVLMDKSPLGAADATGFHAVREAVLRVVGAVLQVLATLAVVRTLAPQVAGIYFEGFIIAYALAALLRGKYEMLLLRFILGDGEAKTCIPICSLIAALGRRIAVRSVLICGALLVLTADLDIMEPRLRPFLGTYLPFVLAVPFVALAMYQSAALRAARQSLGSTIIGAYAINLAIIATAAVVPDDWALMALSWAYCGGAALASGVGALLVRRVFPAPAPRSEPTPGVSDWREIYNAAALHYGVAGMALAGLQWGPLCVLALVGPALQIAEYGVATRMAQIVELMMPALIFVPLGLNLAPLVRLLLRTERGRLLANLLVSALVASALTLVLAILVPQLLKLYGEPYTGITGLFAILLAAQWINGAGRPALRFMTAKHYKPVLGALCASAIVAILIAISATASYGALAAAAAALIGSVILNAQAVWAALGRASTSVSQAAA